MQETTYNDGREVREFFDEQELPARMARAAKTTRRAECEA